MRQEMTFKEYRTLDLFIFALFTIIFELLATYASGKWFWAQAINISVTLLLVCIVMMRWGAWAAIHAVIGGLVYAFAAGATPKQYIICGVGNLFALVALLLIRLWGKEGLRQSRVRLFLFVLTAYFGMAAGRWLVALPLGGGVTDFILYITTDVISLLFASVVFILMKNTDGMIEDQKAYLLRVEREEKEEPVIPEEETIL